MTIYLLLCLSVFFFFLISHIFGSDGANFKLFFSFSFSFCSGDGTLSVCNLRRNKVRLIVSNLAFIVLWHNAYRPCPWAFLMLLISSIFVTDPSSIWVFWRWITFRCYCEGTLVLVLEVLCYSSVGGVYFFVYTHYAPCLIVSHLSKSEY